MSRMAWWAYLVVMACNLAWLLVSAPSEPESWANAVVGAVALLGLAGYIKQVQYGSRSLWKVVFAVHVALFLFYVGKGLIARQSDLLFAGAAFATVLMLPWFLALWRYAFSRPASAA